MPCAGGSLCLSHAYISTNIVTIIHIATIILTCLDGPVLDSLGSEVGPGQAPDVNHLNPVISLVDDFYLCIMPL